MSAEIPRAEGAFRAPRTRQTTPNHEEPSKPAVHFPDRTPALEADAGHPAVDAELYCYTRYYVTVTNVSEGAERVRGRPQGFAGAPSESVDANRRACVRRIRQMNETAIHAGRSDAHGAGPAL